MPWQLRRCHSSIFLFPLALHIAPVSSHSGCKRIAPNTHMVQAVDRPPPIFALAELLPQKNVGAASCPMCRHITYGCQSSGANPKMAHVAGDSQCDWVAA
jgi:hypothetical protein